MKYFFALRNFGTGSGKNNHQDQFKLKQFVR